LLAYEKEVLGIYLSGHPLDEHYKEWIAVISAKTSDFLFTEEGCRIADGDQATIGGIITAIDLKTTKNKKQMAILTLEDIVGTVDVIVFPKQYEKMGSKLVEGEKYFLQGSVKQEEDKDAKLVLEKVLPFEGHADSSGPSELWLQFCNYAEYRLKKTEIDAVLQRFSGTLTVFFYLRTEKQVKKLESIACSDDSQCRKLLTAICGDGNICFK
ncbi:MAG: OB-fold nucleic acid binding domain-containing protein, partial [Butyrivibrio sp.]|nr:OB-fold nucleic acid binding domain-containing protein [Butyrivibrio sp.]